MGFAGATKLGSALKEFFRYLDTEFGEGKPGRNI
jgi:hypothetical protein